MFYTDFFRIIIVMTKVGTAICYSRISHRSRTVAQRTQLFRWFRIEP